MKTCLPALVTLLNGTNVFVVADLYEITLSDGSVLRYTTSPHSVTYSTHVFGTGIGFQRDGVNWTAKPQVDSLGVTMMVDETILVGTAPYQKPIAQAAHEGFFDGARLKMYRAFFTQAFSLVDALVHFEGTVADVNPTPRAIKLTVKSELDKLNNPLPRNLYQPMCSHAWLDGGCDPTGTIRTANTITGTLTGTQTTSVVQIPSNYSANAFKLGVVKLTSGPNEGLRRAIKSDADSGGNHLLTLAVPFPAAPTATDTFVLIKGCDRSFATCTAYGNTANFRGFPYVPRAEDGVGVGSIGGGGG